MNAGDAGACSVLRQSFTSTADLSITVLVHGAAQLFWDPPPSEVRLGMSEVHVWVAALDVEPEMREKLCRLLSPEEVQRASRFHFAVHRYRFAVGRAVLRKLLAQYLEREPQQLQFVYGERGKPCLAAQEPLHFNVAHSADLALLAVCRRCDVGVDVEAIRPMPELLQIARRFFSPGEIASLIALAPEQREVAFFNCWTRKEAFLKATGDGIATRLDQFEVSLAPAEPAMLRSIRGSEHEVSRWTLHDLRLAPGYAGALAFKERGLDVQCWTWVT